MSDFKPGDKVMVKGRPGLLMNVKSITGGSAICMWPVGGEWKEKEFPIETLEPYSPPGRSYPTVVNPGNRRPSIIDRASRIFPRR